MKETSLIKMKKALLVIAKQPAAGQTKTRLCPPLSPPDAAQLYECFLRDMLDVARAVPGVTRLLNIWPTGAGPWFTQLAPDFEQIPQQGDDLGARLDNALTQCLTGGFAQAVITNSDSPTLPADYLTRAFAALNQVDVVLGPCADGGYYLIGLTRPQPRLLRQVPMSTPTVAQETLALARRMGLKTALLPVWYDVDTVAELRQLAAELQTAGPEVAPHSRRFLARHPLPVDV